MKERNNSIDIMKGIGIFLVVLGHTTENKILLKWIYSFHMPLFFFLSGIFHSNGRSYKEFLIKKAKGLLIPYFSFATILFLFFIIVSKNIGFSAGENLSIKENFIGIFIGTDIKNISQVSWGGQLWFLLALFLVSNINYFLEKINFKFQIVFNFLFIYLNIILTKMLNYYLPWCFLTVLMSINFYWCGKILKKYILNTKNNLKIYYIFLLLVLNIIVSQYNLKVEMWGNTYGNIVLFFLGAYSGIFFIILIVNNFFFKYKMIQYIGKNSLVILAFHKRVQTITKVLSYMLRTPLPQVNIIFDLIYSCWQILLCIPIIYILNMYFPCLIGKGKRNG